MGGRDCVDGEASRRSLENRNVESRTLRRGSGALPDGDMHIDGTTQGDLFRNSEGITYVKPIPLPNRTLDRGTLAMPSGRMNFEGTTMGLQLAFAAGLL